jgi:hypothetical protein
MQALTVIHHLTTPRQPTATETHLERIVACLAPGLTLLKELNDAFSPPFIQIISNTIETLIDVVQVRRLEFR